MDITIKEVISTIKHIYISEEEIKTILLKAVGMPANAKIEFEECSYGGITGCHIEHSYQDEKDDNKEVQEVIKPA